MGNKYSYSYNFINGELDPIQSKKDLDYVRYLKRFNSRKYRWIFSDPVLEPVRIREYIYNMRMDDPTSNLDARCSIWSIRDDRLNNQLNNHPNNHLNNHPVPYQNNPNLCMSYQNPNPDQPIYQQKQNPHHPSAPHY